MIIKPKIRKKTMVGAQMMGLLQGGKRNYYSSTPSLTIPSFVSGVTVDYASRTNTDYNGLTGISSGDNLYIYHEIGGSTGSVPVPTAPAGFSLQAGYPLTRSDGGFSVQSYLYKKTAGASETGNYTVTHSNTQSTGFAFCIHGGTLDQISNGNGAAPNSTISGFTVSAANSLVVYLIGGWDLVMESITPPSNLSFTLRNSPDNSLLWVGTASGVSGATGNFSSSNLPVAVWAATAFSLQPA